VNFVLKSNCVNFEVREMNNKTKKGLIYTACTLAVLYVSFLASPLVVTPVIRKYEGKIAELVKSSTGLDMALEKLSFTASWNLRAGVKAEKLAIQIPSNESNVLEAENIGVNVSLLPLLTKKIRLGNLYAQTLNANIDIKKDGSLLALDYIPVTEEPVNESFVLPLGLKLSNKLPDISIKKYNISAVDLITSKKYSLDGQNLNVSDFILDKKIRVKTDGRIIFDGDTVSEYDIKIFNKIMPDMNLQELVFPETLTVNDTSSPVNNNSNAVFNIIPLLQSVADNKLHADLTTDIKTSGTLKSPELNGSFKIDNLTVAVDGKQLPESYVSLKFKGKKTDIDSILFSSLDDKEKTQIIGSLKTGKKPAVDITLRSNAKFMNLINLADSIAKSFEINDFDTLTASGGIDADFNITSDMKKVMSNGYLKILPSKFAYGLYNVSIDKITADINFDNGIDIKKAGFSVLNHPLSLTGTIGQDASTDLMLTADKLSVKGLLAAAGQAGLFKDNDINGGIISMKALIKGKLTELKPELTSILENLRIYNKPSATNVDLTKLSLKANYDGKAISGDLDLFGLTAKNDSASVKIPDTCVLLDNKDIKINKAYLMLNNSKIDVTGGVEDYTSEKPVINISANGKIQSSDIVSFLSKEFVSLISYKGKLPLNIDITGNSKVQNIVFNMEADKDNYISLIDIDKLKNKKTKIKSNLELIGDTLNISQTGIYEGNNLIAKAGGGISKLYSVPVLNIELSVPEQISFPIWGVKNSNITASGSAVLGGTISNPEMKGSISASDISMKDMDFAITELSADLSGDILNGNASVKTFKSGGITASDLSGKFSLKDYNLFTLKDITGKAFDGNVKGKLSYDIAAAKTALDFHGEKLDASAAIYGASGIKDAMTGSLDFDAKLAMQGLTDVDIIKSLKGNVDFDIADGRFVNIGRLENLVAAQNITSNSILKAAISELSTFSTIQEADKFKSVAGQISLAGGIANLSKIVVSGPSMSYYVTGTYNILPNTANLIILGRLDAKIVSVLGVVGDLSVDKLLSSIPKLGSLTSTIWKNLTSDPKNDDVSKIPALSSGSTSYKDFKVAYSGTVGAASSVKYFKWLSSTVETKSDISVKQDLKNVKNTVKENVKSKVDTAKSDAETIKTNVNNVVQTQKNKAEAVKKSVAQTKENLSNTKNDVKQVNDNLKKLLNNAVKKTTTKPAATTESSAVSGASSSQSASTTTSTTTSTATSSTTSSGASAGTTGTDASTSGSAQ